MSSAHTRRGPVPGETTWWEHSCLLLIDGPLPLVRVVSTRRILPGCRVWVQFQTGVRLTALVVRNRIYTPDRQKPPPRVQLVDVLDEEEPIISQRWLKQWRKWAKLHGVSWGLVARTLLPPSARVSREVRWKVLRHPSWEDLRRLQQAFPRKVRELAPWWMQASRTPDLEWSRRRLAQAWKVRDPDPYLRYLEQAGVLQKIVRYRIPGIQPTIWLVPSRIDALQDRLSATSSSMERHILEKILSNRKWGVPRTLFSRKKEKQLIAQLVEEGLLKEVPYHRIPYPQRIRDVFRLLQHRSSSSGQQGALFRWLDRIAHYLREEPDGQTLVVFPMVEQAMVAGLYLETRVGLPVYPYTGGMSGAQRLWVWKHVFSGRAQLVVGTRAACGLPFPKLRHVFIWQVPGEALADPLFARTFQPPTVFLVSELQKRFPECQIEWYPPPDPFRLQVKMETNDEEKGAVQLVPLRKVGVRILPEGKNSRGKLLLSVPVEEIFRELETTQPPVIGMVLVADRGFLWGLTCSACGYIWKCTQCGRVAVYSRWRRVIFCPSCHWMEKAPESCPVCQATEIEGKHWLRGEYVAEAWRSLFPEWRVHLMTPDTHRGWRDRLASIQWLLHQWKEENAPVVLVGTLPLLGWIPILQPDFIWIPLLERWIARQDRLDMFRWLWVLHMSTRHLLVQFWQENSGAVACLRQEKERCIHWLEEEIQALRALRLFPFAGYREIEISARDRPLLEKIDRELQEMGGHSRGILPHPRRRRYVLHVRIPLNQNAWEKYTAEWRRRFGRKIRWRCKVYPMGNTESEKGK